MDFPTNLAILQELFKDREHQTINGDSFFQKKLDVTIPTINIFNHSFHSKLRTDRRYCHKLWQLLANAKQGISSYATLLDAIVDLPALSNNYWFTDYIAYIAFALATFSLCINVYMLYRIRHLIAMMALIKPISAMPGTHPPLIYQGQSTIPESTYQSNTIVRPLHLFYSTNGTLYRLLFISHTSYNI